MPLMINNINFSLPVSKQNKNKNYNFRHINANYILCNDVFKKSTSPSNLSFKGRLHSLEKILPQYNTGTAMKTGEFFYRPEHMLDIIKAAKRVGVTIAYRILGNGVESIAFEVPSLSTGTEVLKISKSPVQDYILDIFNEKACSPNEVIGNDELASYIVPMRKYREHHINGKVWYSYFQDKLISKKFLDGEKDALSLGVCKRFSSQLKRETGYCVYEGENFTDQYGIKRYPNGKREIKILDYGILQKKTEDEADEFWDMNDAVLAGKLARRKREQRGLPDMRILEENLAMDTKCHCKK